MMRLAQFCALSALMGAIIVLDLPSLQSKYLLVEIEPMFGPLKQAGEAEGKTKTQLYNLDNIL